MLLTGKILILSLLTTILSFTTVNEPIVNNSANVATAQMQIGSIGSMIIDDDILIITLNDTGDKIAAVSVRDTAGKEAFSDDNTSSSSSGEYDLSSLTTGSYTVYVTTEKGASFSEDISL